MKYAFFSILALSPDAAQAELNTFCTAHRVANVEKMFVPNGERSFWSVCVTNLDHDTRLPGSGKQKIDYRETLEENEFAIFVKLRTLRKSIAEKEGIPANALFTNEQLAAMVRGRVTSVSALGAIEGIGKARLEKYGQVFLSVLRNTLETPDNQNKITEAGNETNSNIPD